MFHGIILVTIDIDNGKISENDSWNNLLCEKIQLSKNEFNMFFLVFSPDDVHHVEQDVDNIVHCICYNGTYLSNPSSRHSIIMGFHLCIISLSTLYITIFIWKIKL